MSTLAPRYAAIVLAAGSSTRFGSDKLSTPLDGEPLVFHALHAAQAAPVEHVILVARPDLDLSALPEAGRNLPPVEIVRIASNAMSASLQAGIAAAARCDGAFVFLGDMPLVPHGEAGRLAGLIGDHYAALPRRDGRPGHPVLLSASAFPDIARLTGDEGAGRLLRSRNDVVFDECPDPAIHFDVDRPEDLARLGTGKRPTTE